VERPVHQTEFSEFDAFSPYETDVDLCITLGGTWVMFWEFTG